MASLFSSCPRCKPVVRVMYRCAGTCTTLKVAAMTASQLEAALTGTAA